MRWRYEARDICWHTVIHQHFRKLFSPSDNIVDYENKSQKNPYSCRCICRRIVFVERVFASVERNTFNSVQSIYRIDACTYHIWLQNGIFLFQTLFNSVYVHVFICRTDECNMDYIQDQFTCIHKFCNIFWCEYFCSDYIKRCLLYFNIYCSEIF